MNVKDLIDFEKEIADAYNNKQIPYPIHLSGGNETFLIEIFKNFKKGDWCFSSWRNHWHALLSGVPREEVRKQIFAGRSMTVCSPEYRFFSSAIVAGCCPIALGVAWQIKHSGGSERVWLCLGDMAARGGLAHECVTYARLNDLPLVVVVEDNGKSVCTDTKVSWGGDAPMVESNYYYEYTLPWPHAGAGRRIMF